MDSWIVDRRDWGCVHLSCFQCFGALKLSYKTKLGKGS
uniref:Uncharacterized protein n=1 Tax=Arundo donax TaxID=35708 RepID=A0A0A9D2T0_ARUDO